MMASLIGHLSIAQRYTNRFPAGSLELLYGCEDGRVVQLMIEPGAVRQGFTIPPPAGGGAVRALHCGADYSKVRERAAHLRRCTHCCQRGLSWEHHANAVWWCRLCDGVQGRLAGVICSPPPPSHHSLAAPTLLSGVRTAGWRCGTLMRAGRRRRCVRCAACCLCSCLHSTRRWLPSAGRLYDMSSYRVSHPPQTQAPCTVYSQVFATQLPESICSVDGGYVTGPAAAEIIVHTFTGKVWLNTLFMQCKPDSAVLVFPAAAGCETNKALLQATLQICMHR